MSTFRQQLSAILDAPPFAGNQRSLAIYVGVDRGLLHHILSGKREPTPQFVGRLCGTLPPAAAAKLLQAFLHDIVAETARARPKKTASGTAWRQPLKDLSVELQCKPRRKAG